VAGIICKNNFILLILLYIFMGCLRTHLADEAGRHFGLGNKKGRADDILP
jgi:hypothetical protein